MGAIRLGWVSRKVIGWLVIVLPVAGGWPE